MKQKSILSIGLLAAVAGLGIGGPGYSLDVLQEPPQPLDPRPKPRQFRPAASIDYSPRPKGKRAKRRERGRAKAQRKGG